MIRQLSSKPLVRLFSVAVIDQAMLSAANLILVLLLIRYTDSAAYGFFVLAQVSIALASSVLGSWITGPLSVLGPQRSDAQRESMLAEVNDDLRRFLWRLLGLGLPLPLLGAALQFWDGHTGLLGSITVATGMLVLRREFSRSALRIRLLTRELLVADGAFVVALLSLAGLAVWLPGPSAVWALCALGLASFAGERTARRFLGPLRKARIEGQPGAWAQMRGYGIWATVGSVIYWVQSQSFNYALAARLSAATVGHVNASRLMLMPVFLISTGVSSLLLPSAAGWLHHDGLPKLLRRLTQLVAILLLVDLCYLGVLWMMRDWITVHVMKKVIPDRDLLVLLWATHALLGMTREMYQSALLALGRFRASAWLSAVAALAALGVMWWAVSALGAPGAIAGTATGELVFLLGMAGLLVQSYRQDQRRRAATMSSTSPA